MDVNTLKAFTMPYALLPTLLLTNAKMLLFELTVFSTFVLPYSSRLVDLSEAAAWLTLAGPGGNLA